VQLKGTEGLNYVDGGKAISFPMERRHLTYYANEVKLPVFLVVIDVKSNSGFWLFTQQYLSTTLTWRHPHLERDGHALGPDSDDQ
jgi:hypothetical protein